MQALLCEEIIKATKGELISGDVNTRFTGISTDSRKIKSGPAIRDIKKASNNAAICIDIVKGNSKYFLPLNPLHLLTD
jgi:hypothetical protein